MIYALFIVNMVVPVQKQV